MSNTRDVGLDLHGDVPVSVLAAHKPTQEDLPWLEVASDAFVAIRCSAAVQEPAAQFHLLNDAVVVIGAWVSVGVDHAVGMVLVLLPGDTDRSWSAALTGIETERAAAGLQQQIPCVVHQQVALQQSVKAMVLDLFSGEWVVSHCRAVVDRSGLR